MFVVMAVGASEAEILGVKSQILAEGLTPVRPRRRRPRGHRGRRRDRRRASRPSSSRFAALPGVETVTPISRPFKLTSREFHPEDTVIRVLDAVIGDGSLTMMAGPCSVETPRAAVRDGRRGQGGRRDDPARRRLQAADQPVRVPGPRRRGAPLPRRGARADRPAGHHRGDGAEPGRHRRRVRRHPPDRHPEHAELLAACATSGGSRGRSCSSAATAPPSRSG